MGTRRHHGSAQVTCPYGSRVYARHRPATDGRDERLIHCGLQYPNKYMKRAPDPAIPQVKGPFSTWWQVKDSNLRSFRDGFTVPRLHACDAM